MSYVLITGGNSGIGLETAHLFSSKGFSLILVSNEKKSLEEEKTKLTEKYPSIQVEQQFCI